MCRHVDNYRANWAGGGPRCRVGWVSSTSWNAHINLTNNLIVFTSRLARLCRPRFPSTLSPCCCCIFNFGLLYLLLLLLALSTKFCRHNMSVTLVYYMSFCLSRSHCLSLSLSVSVSPGLSLGLLAAANWCCYFYAWCYYGFFSAAALAVSFCTVKSSAPSRSPSGSCCVQLHKKLWGIFRFAVCRRMNTLR